MRDAQGRKLRFVDGLPHVWIGTQWRQYFPTLDDLADDARGAWLLNHAHCVVCGRSIGLKRVRDAFIRRKWPTYCSDTHRERAKKQRQRKRN